MQKSCSHSRWLLHLGRAIAFLSLFEFEAGRFHCMSMAVQMHGSPDDLCTEVEKEGKEIYVDFQEAMGSQHGRVSVKAMSPEIKAG